ncbi:hypothetical protein SNE40_014672 [Patella caerulea]|uniref:Cilia- and flagella-associated protein 61 N-terminal domain-containing protein n=1 Tax=Patella caerulea TaxID=87958 RepID=A0AAN8JF58_PATCE
MSVKSETLSSRGGQVVSGTSTASERPSSQQVINARRTESLDAPHIVKLLQTSTNELFGRVDIVNVIEKAVLAITLTNEHEEILGHAAFYDYPNLDCVDEASWESWLNDNYEGSKCMALNTLFIHLFVAKSDYSHGCAKEIIRTAFTAVPDIHFLLLVVPNGTFPDPALADIFQPMTRLEGAAHKSESTVFVCNRHDHVPVLHVRNARVEDNDDLTPIFNRQSDMLKSIYGDFFLAELIEAQDEEMQCLVAEAEGTACGFVSLNNNVNYDLLNECFELAPFHGLRKPHENDELTLPQIEIPQITAVNTDPKISLSSSDVTKEATEESKDDTKKTDATDSNKTETEKSELNKTSRKSSSSSIKAASITPESLDGEGVSRNPSVSSMGSEAATLRSFKPDGNDTVPGTMYTMSGQATSPKPLFQTNKRFVPTYKGLPNAFAVQLFCIDERYEMRSMDFLFKAFSLFPDYDFCVITVPHLVPEFPLLQGFVRVTPRSPSILSQELYIFNKSGLLKNFNIRTACTKDVEPVEELVKSLDCHTDLLDDFKQFRTARRDPDGKEMQVFVAECLEQIVGVCIIRREEDIEYIRSHYNIEDFIYYNHHRRQDHGHLHHFALNPIFSHMSKHFLKEVLRLGHKTCLYFPLYPPYTDKQLVAKHTMICSLKDLVPVRSRQQIIYPLKELGENAPSERVLKQNQTYALAHINRKLTLEPKVTINARIVVVGASDVGVSFLETLAYCPHLRFNNVTLISPHGLPGEMDPNLVKHEVLSKSHPRSQSEDIWSFLRTWINVVYGKMTGIDRTKKRVVVDKNCVVPYDHLIICTGQQYQVPCPTEASLRHGVTNRELPNSPDRRFMGSQPANLFLVNDNYDSLSVLHKIETKYVNNESKILLYGNNLDTYTCIQSLLQLGIKGSNLLLVAPPIAYDVTCFNNKTVEKCIGEVLKENGVQIHENYLLAEWTMTDAGELSSASFTSDDTPLTIECDAFLSFYKKTVDLSAFKAINDSCLVFDGKLVVDSSFHTNDVAIRGAGTLTKYQRKYHADKWTHANFNSKEIGTALASEILKLFDPTLEQQSNPMEEQLNLIPVYGAPKVQTAILPGGYHYLHVKKPSLDVPLEIQMQNEDYGQELVTGTLADGNYFRLHINLYNSIETITCLSKTEIPCSNLLSLFGIHQKYLNNLLSRFKESLITDFYSFFSESWCQAIFHDRFMDLRDELRELLITSPEEGKETLEDHIRRLIDEEMSLSKSQQEELNEVYKSSGAKRAVETRLLNFISYNYYHLPMYTKPGMV